MRISREATILFGIMLVAALGLIWANFFFQNGGSVGSAPGASSGVLESSPTLPDAEVSDAEVAPSLADEADIADDALGGAVTEPNATAVPLDGIGVNPSVPEVAAPQVTPEITIPEADADVTPEVAPTAEAGSEGVTEAAPTAAPLTPSAARDVEIVTLPFLVTEPPSAEEALAQAQSEDGVARPGEQRVSVNPFSPILLQAVEAPPAPTPTDIPEVTVVDVPIPDAPPAGNALADVAPPTPDAAPPLRTFTPPTPVAATLPRPLPGGTLPATPSILRSAQPAGASNQASAALRLPGSTAASLPADTQASEPVSDEALPDLLGSGAGPASSDCGPIAAGACSLSVYLRNQNVRFTGYVIGPVGVGVFRANGTSTPFALPIGQNLPETDIVLTSLEGKQAEFSQGNETQFLTLDFRR